MRLYRIFIQILCTPIFLSEFFSSETGKDFGIGFWEKCELVYKMIRNNMKIVSGSTFLEHIAMATSLLKVSKDLPGVVVECGTYKGVSAANLSLICSRIGRKLIIFDSFEGLPAPDARDRGHALLASKEMHTYEKGQWCGQLEEVKGNIRQYGKIDACEFVQGYFDKSLPHFRENCVQIFVDVDYRSSLETCVQYLWPLLKDDCLFYTHEAGHAEISSLFFSERWWGEQFKSDPPGLIGAGTGIGLKILSGPYFNSSLGFTIKNPRLSEFKNVLQVGGVKLSLKSSMNLTKGQIVAEA